jgi:hypothetical protein
MRSDVGLGGRKVRRPSKIKERLKTILVSLSILAITMALASKIDFSAIYEPEGTATTSTNQARADAHIVLQSDSEHCKKMVFDNASGKISEDLTPCEEAPVYDARGVAVPKGTVRRLDAISRSFLSR